MSKVNLTAPVIADETGVRGEFVSANMHNIHATRTNYQFTADAVAALTASPDVVTWLKLADLLAEESNPAHHMIRAVFQDGYELPKGFEGSAARSGWYWENGSSYTEGECVEWRTAENGHNGAGFYVTYWANGNFTRMVTLDEARAMLQKVCGTRASRWPTVRVCGKLPPAARIIPAGTTVIVQKGGSAKAVNHATATTVTVPPTATRTYTVWGGISTAVYEFDHMGYRVTALAKDVQSIA